jgi:hypothetical protein
MAATSAELIAMRAMFVTICVPTEASDYLVDDGEMVNLDEVGYLAPADVHQLITLVTGPGGTAPVVLHGVPQVCEVGDIDFLVVFPGQIHQIPNRGHRVPLRAVLNLKVLVFWLKHQHHISRVPDLDVNTVPTVCTWHNQMNLEGGHTVTTTQPNNNNNDWPRTLEYLY